MSTTDRVLKLFGLGERILHDGLYHNPLMQFGQSNEHVSIQQMVII